MELANQNHLTNPLENDVSYDDSSTINLKSLNNEYSVKLDSDTIKYLTAKTKLSTSNDDENDMRMKEK